MRQMKIYISAEVATLQPELNYLFKIFGLNKNVKVEVAAAENKSLYSIGTNTENTFRLSDNFIQSKLTINQFNNNGFFESAPGIPDYLSTAFFCLTSLQEFGNTGLDNLGRFPYKHSYQYKFGNIKRNIVQECFDQMATRLGLPPQETNSTFFLSHDIDSVYGSIKEDGFNVLKRGRFDLFLGMLLKIALGKPEWLNVDKIMKIESEYDCRSTFYWIVNRGWVDKNPNADYDFHSHQIQNHFNRVVSQGFENGIHKSLSDESFVDEIKKFGTMPAGNRYHYLKFNLPKGYDAIEDAGLKLDASLGFSEQCGFRNNYGLPFHPYNFENRRPYTFVEMPLHVMDRTFFNQHMDLKTAAQEIFDFFEANRKNAVLSVLWHNNFFTEYKYKGYLSLYKNILMYIKEGNFGTVNQEQIIQKYAITWP
jgi:hypothetical protein